MAFDIQYSSSALVLPDQYMLISDPDNSVFQMEKSFYKHVAIIASFSNKEASWEKVKNGKAFAQCYICVTEDFADNHKVHLNSYALRMSDIKGVTVGMIWIMPDGVIKSIYDNAKKSNSGMVAIQQDAQREFEKICQDAVIKGASDIHFSINDDICEILYRIDGDVLFQSEKGRDAGILILSSAFNSLAEQDSRSDSFSEKKYLSAVIQLNFNDLGVYRFRYESSPEGNGVVCVLRILPVGKKGDKTLSMTDLGMSKSHEIMMHKMLSRPDGIVIVAGTTGSGKTTTLKNIIESEAQRYPTKNYCSIEEPIEFSIKKVRQIPVVRDDSSGQGTSAFGLAIRSLLRLDPDVLMIGEIRDWETAELAASATESGHFVFSTVHTSSALAIVPRLSGTKLKLPLDQVTAKGFIAGMVFQKLIPKLCKACKKPIDLDSMRESDDEHVVGLYKRIKRTFSPEEISGLMVRGEDDSCHTCSGKGNLGRTVCVETVIPTEDIMEAFIKKDQIGAYRAWRAQATDDPDNFEGKPALLHALRKAVLGEVSVFNIEEHFGFIDAIAEEESQA